MTLDKTPGVSTTKYIDITTQEKSKHEGLRAFFKRTKEKNISWVINLTIPKDLKAQAIALCEREKMPISKLFYFLLWNYFNEKSKSNYC